MGGATDYHLDVSTSATFNNYVSGYKDLDVGNGTNFGVTGLSGGTTYYYRVRAVNAGGTSPNSNTINATTVPAAPVAQNANKISNIDFTANWKNATGATGYRLDVSTDSSFGSYVAGYQDLDVGNVTSYDVTSLTPQTTYYYRVRAYNVSGTSGNSNVVTTTTLFLTHGRHSASPNRRHH